MLVSSKQLCCYGGKLNEFYRRHIMQRLFQFEMLPNFRHTLSFPLACLSSSWISLLPFSAWQIVLTNPAILCIAADFVNQI